MTATGQTTDAPHDWLAGIKRIPLHSLFAAVGVGARFLPLPWKSVVLGAFALWRMQQEYSDYKNHRDTASKALIDLGSQVGAAAAGAFIG